LNINSWGLGQRISVSTPIHPSKPAATGSALCLGRWRLPRASEAPGMDAFYYRQSGSNSRTRQQPRHCDQHFPNSSYHQRYGVSPFLRMC